MPLQLRNRTVTEQSQSGKMDVSQGLEPNELEQTAGESSEVIVQDLDLGIGESRVEDSRIEESKLQGEITAKEKMQGSSGRDLSNAPVTVEIMHNIVESILNSMQDKIDKVLENNKKNNERLEQSLKNEIEGNNERLEQSLKNEIEGNNERLERNLKREIEMNNKEIQGGIKALESRVMERLGKELASSQNKLSEQLELQRQEIDQVTNEKFERVYEQLKLQREEIVISQREEIEKTHNKIEKVNEQVIRLTQEIDDKVPRIMNEVKDTVDKTIQQIGILSSRQDDLSTLLESNLSDVRKQIEVLNCRINYAETSTNNKFKLIEETVEKINNSATSKDVIQIVNKEMETGSESSGETPDTSAAPHSSTLRVHLPVPSVNSAHMERNGYPGNLNFLGNEITLPKFSNNAGEHPLKFLRDLENFLEIRSVPDCARMSVVRHALKGSVGHWAEIQLAEDVSYDLYKKLFLDQFWDINKQREVRSLITSGRYDPRGKKSMCDYFIDLSHKARYLDPPIPSNEFISLISDHFPPEIRGALIIAKPSTFPEVLQLLKDLQPRAARNFQSSKGRVNEERMPGNKSNENRQLREGAYDHNFSNSHQQGDSHQSGQSPRRDNNNSSNCNNYNNGNSNYNRNNRNSDRFRGNQNNDRPNNGGHGNQNRNNSNNQNREARINFMSFDQGQSGRPYNRNGIPHWWRRRGYNNAPWRPRNYFNWRYRPYEPVRYNHNNDDDRYSEGPEGGENGNRPPNRGNDASLERVSSLIRNQNERRASSQNGNGPSNGEDARPSLNQ